MADARVRQLALVAAALTAALMLAMLDRDAPRRSTADARPGPEGPARGRAALPEIAAAPAQVAAFPLAPVELSAGGELLLDGRPVGLAALRKACEGREVVTLNVAERVPWAHVGLVLDALQEATCSWSFCDRASTKRPRPPAYESSSARGMA